MLTAREFQQAAQTLRDLAPVINGPLARIVDPVAEWLEESSRSRNPHPVAVRVARAVNGTECICTEDAWPPHCPCRT